MHTLLIPGRFNGPASSGNGGWTSGALAGSARALAGWTGDVTVQLRRPPPLDRPLDVVHTGDVVELRDGDDVVALASPAGELTWAPPAFVDPDTARDAEASFAGHRSHPFPRCFSCGPDRDDGLGIFPGRVDDDRVAATWTPDRSLTVDAAEFQSRDDWDPAQIDPDGADGPDGAAAVTEPVTWAALDCVSAWSSDLEHRPLVLASMTARIESPPQAGTAYVVVGTTVRIEGRKTWTASALYDGAGLLLAQAQHLWIAIDPSAVEQLQRG